MTRRYVAAISALALLALCTRSEPSHARETRSESGLKAAFLYRFASLTRWPESSFAGRDSPIRFGVVGDTEITRALGEATAGKQVRGRPVEVVAVDSWAPGQDIHVMFLSNAGSRASTLHDLEARPILTVGDSNDFVKRGGMIQLQSRGKRLAFSINRAAAKRAGLRIDPKLLRLAVEVVDDVSQ
ncbi:MAG: YfiR family protein [Myxococcota bacterium]